MNLEINKIPRRYFSCRVFESKNVFLEDVLVVILAVYIDVVVLEYGKFDFFSLFHLFRIARMCMSRIQVYILKIPVSFVVHSKFVLQLF